MLKHLRTPLVALVFFAAVFWSGCSKESKDIDWPVYHGDKSGSHYSAADQITADNVDQLTVAWTFDAGDVREGDRTLMECNPLIIDGVVYATTARLKVVALNGTTGELVWQVDPVEELNKTLPVPISASGINRGLAYWSDGAEARIFYGVANYLLAINPMDGGLIESFGQSGKIDLKQGLGRDIESLAYNSKTPGVVFDNLIIMGAMVSESLPTAPGHIRAFDVRTGEQVWRFNTIPHPGEFGYDTWPPEAYKEFGGANVWTGLTVDEERGLVYCPTGSATFDFYGGDRLGQNLFANSLICLNARSGERVWHYQMVHHDLWDYDLPAPPNLLTIRRGGKEIPAVAQLTKQGFVFVFNRETGEPLFPIEERPSPKSEMPGEEAWPTQPRPTKPAPYVREIFSIDQITDISPESHAEILVKYSTLLPHVPFQPPSEKRDTIVHPGMIGGVEWGGGATDPNGILYFNANQSTAMLTMLDTSEGGSIGETVYKLHCMACHGPDLKGGNAFGQVVPSLVDIASRTESDAIVKTIMNGGTAMPAFRHLSGKDIHHLLNYLEAPGQSAQHEAAQSDSDKPESRFIHTGNRMWYDSQGYPAIKPPWGTLNAIDLNTGEYLWTVNFGEYQELLDKGIPPTGRESFGGPIVTKSGLLFIGGSLDNHIRAYDMQSGKELWRDKLPAGGYATASTYRIDGKQFVIIACGGGRGSPAADKFVAYALP